MFIKFEQSCSEPDRGRKFKTLEEAFAAAKHKGRSGSCGCRIAREMRPAWGSGHYKLAEDGTLDCVSYDYDTSG